MVYCNIAQNTINRNTALKTAYTNNAYGITNLLGPPNYPTDLSFLTKLMSMLTFLADINFRVPFR